MDIKSMINPKIKYLALALALGVFLIVISSVPQKKEAKTEIKSQEESLPGVDETEEKLAGLIESIDGVSEVSVFLTYNNLGEKKIAYTNEFSTSEEKDKKEKNEKNDYVKKKNSSAEEPFVTEEVLPEVRGVIICARGVGSEGLRLKIADAVASALGISVNYVKVLPKDR